MPEPILPAIAVCISKFLTKITTNPTYNKLRDNVWDMTGKIPVLSKPIRKILKKTEEGIKVSLTEGGLFEELGIRYIGPIDGHNIPELIRIFKTVKEIKNPILLHIYTNKAKRIKHFESNDAVKYYSISPKNKSSNQNSFTFSKVFGNSILSLAKDIDFRCITAAMEIGTGLSQFAKLYSDRYIDVAISEQHALTYSSGIAASGNQGRRKCPASRFALSPRHRHR